MVLWPSRHRNQYDAFPSSAPPLQARARGGSRARIQPLVWTLFGVADNVRKWFLRRPLVSISLHLPRSYLFSVAGQVTGLVYFLIEPCYPDDKGRKTFTRSTNHLMAERPEEMPHTTVQREKASTSQSPACNLSGICMVQCSFHMYQNHGCSCRFAQLPNWPTSLRYDYVQAGLDSLSVSCI